MSNCRCCNFNMIPGASLSFYCIEERHNPEVGKLWAAGRMWPVTTDCAAHESPKKRVIKILIECAVKNPITAASWLNFLIYISPWRDKFYCYYCSILYIYCWRNSPTSDPTHFDMFRWLNIPESQNGNDLIRITCVILDWHSQQGNYFQCGTWKNRFVLVLGRPFLYKCS